ncbi:hypothetical protein NCC49_000012 [Naganishia albida]|nr:hypothetical protein NCC49_000012 [Naganishia albida]
MSSGTLPLSAPLDSADGLVAAIDFAAKGLTQARVTEYHPQSGRLVLKATYLEPKAGWPVLDRRTIEEIAGTKDVGGSKSRWPICLGEDQEAAPFPLPVVIIITLLQPGTTSDAYLQLVRAHSQLYANDFRPFQLPIAFWRTAEGIWILVRDESAVALPQWWAEHVRPSILESERLWRIAEWRRRNSPTAPVLREKEEDQATRLSSILQSSVATDNPFEECQGAQNSERLNDETNSVTSKRVVVDEEEDEAMNIDRGWLAAVEILIQMADILLSLHERRLSVVVSRPDLYDVVENQPFRARSKIFAATQGASIELNHIIAAVPMQGYDEGKIVDGQKSASSDVEQEPEDLGCLDAEMEHRWMVDDGEAGGAVHRVLDQAAMMRHLRFIAPEVISSKQTITPAADIYSWAATAFELIKGHRLDLEVGDVDESPGNVADFYGAVHSHSTRTSPSLKMLSPSIPEELAAIVLKAGSLDPEERYGNFAALLCDLNRSRFKIPPSLLDREGEYATLDDAYRLVKTTGQSQVALAYGKSGSGKSSLLQVWANAKEKESAGQECLVGRAKMDQHLVKPLSAFISVFCSLLARVFSDPLESTSAWRRRILDSLAVNANIFLALLPKEWQVVLLDGQEVASMDNDMTAGIDWESWVEQFRTWSYGLLRLFASEKRPLIIVIDDVQWLEKSEKQLWDELGTSATRRLDHCLILLSYRTADDTPPVLAPMTPGFMIQARSFDRGTIVRMVVKAFHLDDDLSKLSDQWEQFVTNLYESTRGNPFDTRWALSTMVRDGNVYYDYVHKRWAHRTEALALARQIYDENSAASIFNGLSSSARLLLCYLACLPSRGVEISLLARLVNKSESVIRPILDECIASGSITVTNLTIQFVHDKPHAAALASISETDRPRLFVTIARALEGFSTTDYHFVQADMLLSAQDAESALVTKREVVAVAVRAARTAAVSGALALASSYLERSTILWPYDRREAWVEDPELAFNLLTVSTEVALGSGTALRHTARVENAVQHIPSLHIQIGALIWLFRLQLSTSDPRTPLKTFFRAVDLVGYRSRNCSMQPIPSVEGEILSLLAAPEPPRTDEGLVARSLADLMGIAGPTIYSFAELKERSRILSFVIPILLRNHNATRHWTSAYTWYLHAILMGCEDTSRLKTAQAWIKVADSYRLEGGPVAAAIETLRATVAYITTTELETVDYSRAHRLCLATNNFDIMSYVLGLDLATRTLSGADIGSVFKNGKTTLDSLKDSLQPAARMMTVPFIQFGANLADTELPRKREAGSASLSVLEGDFVMASDIARLPETAPLYALVYGMASLYLGLLFQVSPDDIRQRAAFVQQYQHGGLGTIFRPFTRILMAIASLILDDGVVPELPESTALWLDAFPQNRDFRAVARMLRALEAINERRREVKSSDAWLGHVESALESLEEAHSFLFIGFLCLQVDDLLSTQLSMGRLRNEYLLHARSAFQACAAINLVKVVDARLIPRTSYLAVRVENQQLQSGSSVKSGSLSPSIPGGLEGDLGRNSVSSSASKATVQARGKLELEEILRSFLILASEKNSDGLVRRVLQVLLQVTCTQYASFATHDPVSASVQLRGYGTYDDIKVCPIPLSLEAASGLAPCLVISHVAVTKKTMTDSSIRSAENAGLIAREPFFAANGLPKTLLVLPLFVQGRLSSLLYLSGVVPSSGLLTSQVGLLATFAAIILESNQAYATLEATVTTRTQQLQRALYSRSTFISGVSHELRTPLFAISGLCSVMENSSDLTESQSENLRIIGQSAEDLQRIVTDVLDWSKLDAGAITPEAIPFDLRVVVENALETVSHLARSKNITLFLENPVNSDPPMALLGDPHRYRQCLLNLLSNAIKFTKPATLAKRCTVSVAWSWKELSSKVAITCTVKDEGIGIHAKSMHKLFHSFSQVDSGISRTFGGTGLGLSITRGLARTMGGDCWAESAEGRGSTFYLMVATEKAKKPEPLQFAKDPISNRRATILAEQTDATDVLRANLESFGIHTVLGSLGNCATEPPADLIIVDVDNLKSASEEIDDLKQRHTSSKIIFLVNFTDQENLSGNLKDEVIVFKPLKARSLYHATRRDDSNGSTNPNRKRKEVWGKMDAHYAQVRRTSTAICYIDDSSVNVAVGTKILSKFGYKDIDVCHDGLQAVAAAGKTKYDLLLMDLQMPNMDGHQAKKIISGDPACGDPYIVALTANSDQHTRDRCIQDEQFQGFLTKPLVINSQVYSS